MRLKTGIQAALTCGVLLCAAAQAQEPTPVKGESVVQAQTAAVAGAMRKPTNVEAGSPEAKMFASNNAPIVTAQPGEESAGKSKDGSTKIHGHWVIEVKEKDGTVKDRREFENSYIGGYIMGLFLAGFDVAADPAIILSSSANGAGSLCNGLQNTTGSTKNNCGIYTSLSAGHGALDTTIGFCATAGSCYGGLTATLTPVGGPYTSWVLSATIAPVTTGTFNTVETTITNCYDSDYNSPATISPNTCYSNAVAIYNATGSPYIYNSLFTSTTLPGGAVTVTSGETLVFTVTISFS